MSTRTHRTPRSTAALTSEQVQACGERLEQIEAQRGSLTARAVVEDARDADSPLHPHFEWDDGAAADAFRLNQAEQLIRCVVYVPPSGADAGAQRELRAWAPQPATDAAPGAVVYVRMQAPQTTPPPAQHSDAVTQALRELRVWRARWGAIEQLAPVARAIADAIERLKIDQQRQAMRRSAPGRLGSPTEHCGHPGCTDPGRYGGYCMRHWKEAPADVQIVSAAG